MNTKNKYTEGDFIILVPGVISSRKKIRREKSSVSQGDEDTEETKEVKETKTKEKEKKPEEIRLKEENELNIRRNNELHQLKVDYTMKIY